ncbi:MAG: hypothetical protein H6707_19415 [Deltaproteobacteria bacterium]|nr:hypothetical protein [Deltaproteobacteria bacterium]
MDRLSTLEHSLRSLCRGASLFGALLLIACISPANAEEGNDAAKQPSKSIDAVKAASAANGSASSRPATAHGSEMNPLDYPVPQPPFSEGIFPCTECHETTEKPNTTRRELTEEHESIKLEHGPRKWCFSCHNPTDRDKLRLADGELIPFTVSYRLCGQCHGPKLREWRVGIHGKRTGYWNGKKRYLLCAHCHNPHSPHFKPIKPLPPPRRPLRISTKGGKR